ncbi:MAG: TIGR04076 family protein [Proteobacteria bacterium]|nr:TIGR04076 family protein [Pseudomonadota bacterium]
MLATIVAVKGTCNAGHESGDRFTLSCRYPGELCGYFFHDIFPNLSVIQHGGAYPWWTEGQNKFEYHCPDRHNQVTLLVEVLAE